MKIKRLEDIIAIALPFCCGSIHIHFEGEVLRGFEIPENLSPQNFWILNSGSRLFG